MRGGWMTVAKRAEENVIYLDRCTVIAPCEGQKFFKDTHRLVGVLEDGCSCAYCGEHIWDLQRRIRKYNKKPLWIFRLLGKLVSR